MVGPTATGKTALSIAMANEAPIEVVSADSRMIYRWMDIGTAKPSVTERANVAHHLIDIADPDESFTVVDWVAQARAAIERIWARGRQPVVVGGTGLYFRALCDGLEIPPVPPDVGLRSVLEERAHREGWQALHAELESIDPVSASRKTILGVATAIFPAV
ncbi:MAG: tRNA (adenosine(37)-N6)-dimethylallyltransferase MiaA [Chloroflexi bacterium]|nr:tRNA (adenosine(37)-N6)-dimethylallyltransferase MiaA [Chloroflexota bacterium]